MPDFMKLALSIKLSEARESKHVRLFSMPHDSFMLFGLSVPFSLSLRFYDRSAIVVPAHIFLSELFYVLVESCKAYLILLKRHDVLVQPFSDLRIRCLIIGARVGQIGSMELKVRWIVDQELLRRD
jgi:hypothetical protein